jgi:hypothetical protein
MNCLMGCIDHRLSRSGERLQRRQCQLSLTRSIAFEVGTVRRGYGCSNLIYRVGGLYQALCHWRLRPADLLRPRRDGGL